MSLEERARRTRAMERVAALIDGCRKCGIGATRTNAVAGEGHAGAALLVVGEGPGETEDKLGRPFVGRAGELLDKMLASIDLPREDVFITNTVKCRPTLNDSYRLRNRAPDPEEMRNCRPYLDQQIDIIAPRIILALGAPAAKSFMGDKFSITKQRGQWFEGPHGIPTIATFHPAYILRQTGGELMAMKRLVHADLRKLRAKLDEPLTSAQTSVVQETLFE